ncbi:major facilitator superfamily transporter protein [Rutstroemia sp. NJR-2017a BVV2]|nr:major facilitator superfamily transporter protein [Rutstroemia sp. NJR-2017a BVV2]
MPLQISYRPSSSSPTYNLIFFITGNPGLISYYEPFLSTLHAHLSSSNTPHYHIFGQSLAGFETHDDIAEDPSIPQKLRANRILSRLSRLTPPPSALLSGILLFPTLTHISQSPSGLKLSPLVSLPNFPLLASSVAKGLLYLSPNPLLDFLIPKVTGMPAPAAKVTRDFLRSRQGVQQALYLAKDEMVTIGEDRWSGEIWGVENLGTESVGTETEIEGEGEEKKKKTPRLVFYFGSNDHWVAEHTRDALIAARGRNGVAVNPESVSFSGEAGNKPVMMIDEEGIDHSFCVHSSEPMAEKVSRWVKEIVKNV